MARTRKALAKSNNWILLILLSMWPVVHVAPVDVRRIFFQPEIHETRIGGAKQSAKRRHSLWGINCLRYKTNRWFTIGVNRLSLLSISENICE